jgi:hypothetical protein
MLDQGHRIDLLQRAVEAMAEQMVQLQAELSTLRSEAEASSQRQRHLMARADQIDAMQASLSALEDRLVLVSRRSKQAPRPSKQPIHQQQKRNSRRTKQRQRGLIVILLGGLSLFGGLALALRAKRFQREAIPAVSESMTRCGQANAGSSLKPLMASCKI